MLRRVPPFEACGETIGFKPWGSTLSPGCRLAPFLKCVEEIDAPPVSICPEMWMGLNLRRSTPPQVFN